MVKYVFSARAIALTFSCHEETNNRDFFYEYDRTFYVSVEHDEMLEDIALIGDALELDSDDLNDLLSIIKEFQKDASLNEPDFFPSDGHGYIVYMEYLFSADSALAGQTF